MSTLRTRWAAIGAAASLSLGGGGLLTASASLDGGDRPVFVPIAPCRLLDTRPGSDNVGIRAVPLGPGDTYVAAVRGVNGNCSIPADAVGVAMNVAIVHPTASSFLTVFPADAPRPLAANLNWVAGQDPTPNAVVADLSADGRIAFYNLAGTVHLAVDVNGYFVDHTHDDRYHTKAQTYSRAEIDAKFLPPAGGSRVTLDPTTDVAYDFDIAIGLDGNPVIGYHDVVERDLVVAACSNPSCTGSAAITTLDAAGSVGQPLAIAVGPDGLPVISYYDSTTSAMKVAKCTDLACSQPATISVIDADAQSYFLGVDTDIRIAPTGLPVVVHRTDNSGGVRVTTCGNPACSERSQHTVGSAALNPSLAFLPDGRPIFSTNTYLSFDLLVTACADVLCTGDVTTTIDSADDVGHNSSIVARPDGTAVVGYYDNTNDDLKVASCHDADCTAATIVVVDSTGSVGYDPSLALGPDGNPVIAYEDATGATMKVAVCGNPACAGAASTGSVDPAGAPEVAMAIGADGLPVLVHARGGATELRFVKCGSLSCQP